MATLLTSPLFLKGAILLWWRSQRRFRPPFTVTPYAYETLLNPLRQHLPVLTPDHLSATTKRQMCIPEYLVADEVNAIIKAAPNL